MWNARRISTRNWQSEERKWTTAQLSKQNLLNLRQEPSPTIKCDFVNGKNSMLEVSLSNNKKSENTEVKQKRPATYCKTACRINQAEIYQ